MEKPRNRNRPLRLYIYVTQEELDDIRGKAKAAGLSVGEYGRRVALIILTIFNPDIRAYR